MTYRIYKNYVIKFIKTLTSLEILIIVQEIITQEMQTQTYSKLILGV